MHVDYTPWPQSQRVTKLSGYGGGRDQRVPTPLSLVVLVSVEERRVVSTGTQSLGCVLEFHCPSIVKVIKENGRGGQEGADAHGLENWQQGEHSLTLRIQVPPPLRAAPPRVLLFGVPSCKPSSFLLPFRPPWAICSFSSHMPLQRRAVRLPSLRHTQHCTVSPSGASTGWSWALTPRGNSPVFLEWVER